jgi:DNA-binding FrmR family transcriptional regulator
MQLPDETVDDLLKRLKRIEGQVRGIQSMLSEERDCRDVVTQVSAATKALEQVGFSIVAAGLTWCIANPKQSADEGYAIEDVKKMFLKLA